MSAPSSPPIPSAATSNQHPYNPHMSSPLANFALVAESYIVFINSFTNTRTENLYTLHDD